MKVSLPGVDGASKKPLDGTNAADNGQNFFDSVDIGDSLRAVHENAANNVEWHGWQLMINKELTSVGESKWDPLGWSSLCVFYHTVNRGYTLRILSYGMLGLDAPKTTTAQWE